MTDSWIEAAAKEIHDLHKAYFCDWHEREAVIAAIIRRHFGCLTAQELHYGSQMVRFRVGRLTAEQLAELGMIPIDRDRAIREMQK